MTAKVIQLKKVEVQLKVWGNRIDRLQAKAKTLQAIEDRNGYQGQLNELAQKQVNWPKNSRPYSLLTATARKP
jgi:hypothetical protein